MLLVASSCFRTPTATQALSQHQQQPPHNPRQQHAPRVTSRSGSKTKTKNEGRLLLERPRDQGRSRTVHIPGEQRRNFLNIATRMTLAAAWAVALPASSSRRANAVMQNIPDNVFQVGKDLSRVEAQHRFQQGQTSLTNLLEQYEMICDQGGGDNIRRYLGTVGMTSGLYGITKVLKVLQETATDIVDYTETMEEFNAALTGADGSAYMAIFAGSSTSTVPATQYYQDAKRDIQRAHQLMQELAKQLELNEASK